MDAKLVDDWRVEKILKERQMLVEGDHFVYTSGRHGSVYFNKDAIFPYVNDVDSILTAALRKFYGSTKYELDGHVQAAVGPVQGGAILAHYASKIIIGDSHRPFAVFADKVDGGFVIKRGYDKLIEKKRVLIVEDVLTTGGSVKKVIEATRNCNAEVVGVVALVNRGGITTEDLGVENFSALIDLDFESFPEEDCSLCKEGVPINIDLGKGREFLAKRS